MTTVAMGHASIMGWKELKGRKDRGHRGSPSATAMWRPGEETSLVVMYDRCEEDLDLLADAGLAFLLVSSELVRLADKQRRDRR